MENISIGYLTWKNLSLFEKTLKSHKDNGLFDLIPPQNRTIFIQEINYIDIELAKKYECNYIGDERNIGVLLSFIELINDCKTDYLIYSQNDFILMNTKEFEIKKTLEDAIEILKENNNAQVKLSNIKKPGFLYCTPRCRKRWQLKDQSKFPYKIESLSWVENPEEFYKNINIEIIQKNYNWYSCSTSDQVWSDHIYMASTKYLKEVILPILKFNNNHIDLKSGIFETKLVLFKELKNQDKNLDKLLEIYENSKVISGGGNFYHNKIPRGNRRIKYFYDNAYC